MATAAQRAHLHALATELYRHRGQLDYPPGDVRQAEDARDWTLTEQQAMVLLEHGGRMMFDCSEFCAWLLKCAGLWPFAQPGWTGSDLAAAVFPHYTDPRQALTGALVVFGRPPGHHMAMVYTPDPKGGNPVCVSHGRPGLDLQRLKVLEARQPPGLVLLSIAHL